MSILENPSQPQTEKSPGEGNSDLVKEARSFLAGHYGMNPESVDSLLHGLKDSLSQNFQGAEKALKQADLESLSRHAHSIKGALRNLGLDQWALRAEYIEKHQGDAGAERLPELAGRLQELQEGIRPLL